MTEVSSKIAADYLAALKSGAISPRGKLISDGTYRDHLITLDRFFKWLKVRDRLLVNPVAGARQAEGERPLRLPHTITAEEMMRILQACVPTTALGLRDRAILELLYSTGIRWRELANLAVGDFRLESR